MPYIGNTIRAADDYRLIDDISSGFNGSATSFALQVAGSSPVPFPKSPQQILVSVNGVIQEPDPTGASGFNLVGTNIVFSSAPTNGHAFFGIIYATADYLNAGGEFPAGSVGAPSFTFIGDEDTGIYRKGSGSVGFVSNATEIANTDSNGITISSGNLILGDSSGSSSDRVVLGAGSDLQIYHDGTDSYISDTGTGALFIQGDSAVILEAPNGENYFKGQINGASHIYYDGVIKLSTTTTGILVADKTQIDGASGSTELILKRTNTANSAGHSYGTIKFNDSSDNVIGKISTIRNTATDDGDIRFEAKPTGGSLTEYLRIKSTGNVQIPVDNAMLQFGAGQDLKIAHTGSESYIQNSTGALQIQADDLKLFDNSTAHLYFRGQTNSSVELYFDNSKKFETTSSGVHVLGTFEGDNFKVSNPGNNAVLIQNPANGIIGFGANNQTNQVTISADGHLGIPTDSGRLRLGASEDLQIYHDGTSNIILANSGDLNIRMNNSENSIVARQNGAAELYYDNSKKLETTSTGVSIPGILQMGTSSSYIDLPDNASLYCGTGDDLRIFHDGTNSIINNSTGNLQVIASNQFRGRAQGYVFNSYDDQEGIIKGFQNGAVELYYDGSKKFETTSNGATFLDNVRWNDNKAARFGGGDDLQIYHDGSHSIINNTTGSVQVQDAGTEKFRVSGTGTFFKDDIHLSNDNDKLNFGAGNDLQIYSNGVAGIIDHVTTGTGADLILRSKTIVLRNLSNESMIVGNQNGAVQLYYDNSTKLETTSGGIDVTGRVTTDDLTVQKASGNLSVMVTADSGLGTMEIGGSTGAFIDLKTPSSNDFDLRIGTSGTAGYILAAGTGIISIQGHPTPAANNTYDLGTTSLRWRNVYTNDLNLSNEGGANDVDGTWGNYTIQEGAEDLFLINRRNGKKFKFNLMEVA